MQLGDRTLQRADRFDSHRDDVAGFENYRRLKANADRRAGRYNGTRLQSNASRNGLDQGWDIEN